MSLIMILPRWNRWFTTLGVLALALASAGCLNLKPKPDSTRYYLLQAPSPKGDGIEPGVWAGLPVFVERVEVPEYLDPREMVTRRADREVVYSGAHQWAEPVRDGITRVLRDVLGRRLGTGSVAATQVRRPVGAYLELQAAVSRFEWTVGREAVLEARWQITEQPARRLVAAGETSASQSVDPEHLDYGGGVEALSACLEVWGIEVAAALGAHSSTAR